MRILRTDDKRLALEEIDQVVADLLSRIPAAGDPSGSEAALARLFPQPTGGREPTAEAEWREFVEPDLRELFRDAMGVVEEDLKKMGPAGEKGLQTLFIPLGNLEAWIHALNQARLALAARYEFTDLELERETPQEDEARAFVIFQIHFYGLLQEFFLRQLD